MLACFHQADNAHNQPRDGADNRDNEKPAENSAHNAEYERAYREIILFMLQLVNDYRSLGIDLWLLAIVCSLIGRGHLLAAIIRAAVILAAVILARVRSSLGGYILLIGILLVLLVRILLIRILLIRILLVSLVIIIVGIIVIIHLITPVCLK